jgi:hypothetical protein
LAACAKETVWTRVVADAAVLGVGLEIDTAILADRKRRRTSAVCVDAGESSATRFCTISAVEDIFVWIDASAKADFGCGRRARSEALAVCTELPVGAGVVASSAVTAIGGDVNAGSIAALEGRDANATSACAGFGCIAWFVASAAMEGIAVK